MTQRPFHVVSEGIATAALTLASKMSIVFNACVKYKYLMYSYCKSFSQKSEQINFPGRELPDGFPCSPRQIAVLSRA